MEQVIFIGLGNVGQKFAGTRHNLGIEVLKAWATTHGVTEWKRKEGGAYEESGITPLRQGFAGQGNQESEVICLFPTTMMNNSGQAVAEFLKNRPLPLDRVYVIHDDVELPLGEARVTLGGSAKGHNGVRSIQQALGTQEFQRLRLGIGRPPEGVPLNDFVLERFVPAEQAAITALTQQALRELDGLATRRPGPE